MRETARRRWARRFWDPESFEVVCRTAGTDPETVEDEAGLKHGRFEDLEENGWQPYVWELRHMADVLGMTMDALYEEAFLESR